MINLTEASLDARKEYAKLLKYDGTGRRNYNNMTYAHLIFNYHLILDDKHNLRQFRCSRKEIENELKKRGCNNDIVHLNDKYIIKLDDVHFAYMHFILEISKQASTDKLFTELEGCWKHEDYTTILVYLLCSFFLTNKSISEQIRQFLASSCGWFNDEIRAAIIEARKQDDILLRIASWWNDPTNKSFLSQYDTVFNRAVRTESIVLNNKNKNKLDCDVIVDNYSGWFKTEKGGDALLSGKVDQEGLWKNFARELNCKKDDIKITVTNEIKNNDIDKTYYHVSCLLPQLTEDTEIEEDIEKHETLNSILFDENEKLLPEVKDKLLEIAKDFTNGLDEDEIKYKLTDIKLVGSNASYNFTKDSDIDLHLLFDLNIYRDEEKQNMAEKIYDYAKSIWNKNHDVSIKGIPVEIYAETNNTEQLDTNPILEEALNAESLTEAAVKSALTSNGIYSVLNDDWIKKPEQEVIPEVNQEAIQKALQPWLDSAEELKNTEEIEVVEKWLDDLYEVRRHGLKDGGEYSIANCIFKELRNLGILDEVKDLKKQLENKKLSLESLGQELISEQADILDEKTRNYYYKKISEITRNQVILNSNGNFQINLVKEVDVDDILAKLMSLSFIEVAHANFSKYDFSNMNFVTKLPSKYYTISGRVTARKTLR